MIETLRELITISELNNNFEKKCTPAGNKWGTETELFCEEGRRAWHQKVLHDQFTVRHDMNASVWDDASETDPVEFFDNFMYSGIRLECRECLILTGLYRDLKVRFHF